MDQALFWDFDGTLTNSGPQWGISVEKALDAFGYSLPLQDIRKHLRKGYPWHFPERDYTHIRGTKYWDYLFNHFNLLYRQEGIPEKDFDPINNLIRDRIISAEIYTLYPDAVSTLEACRARGWKNYLLSNNFPELEEVIRDRGIHHLFSGFVVSAMVGYEKPRKELFDYALDLAGRPKTVYMIGDNPVADVEGAKGVGMKTILVHNDEPCEADFICGNLADILEILP